MRLWRKSVSIICSISFFCALQLQADKNTGIKTPTVEKKEEKDPAKTEKKDEVAGAVPIGQPIKGLHLPFYDLAGKLKMQFDAKIATRSTENYVELTELKIETYDELSQLEMLVQLPRAAYDLGSGIISSKEDVKIQRKGFLLTGVGLEFDSRKKVGKVFNKIRMEIYNRNLDTPTATPKNTSNGS